MTEPISTEDLQDRRIYQFPTIDGDGDASSLRVTLYRRSQSDTCNLVAVLDGEEFIRSTHLVKLLRIANNPQNLISDVISIPPGDGDRSRNEKYFGAGDYFDYTINNVSKIIRYIGRTYKKVHTLTVMGASLTGRAALDVTALVIKENEKEPIFESFRVCAVAPSLWQFFHEPLCQQLSFMIDKWWLHNRSDTVEQEKIRRLAMMKNANRTLVSHMRYLYDADIYLLISYAEYLRFSGDIPGAKLEDMVAKLKDNEDIQFPNLRRLFRLFTHFDREREQAWIDYLRYRLKEFTVHGQMIEHHHYDVFYPTERVCNIIYKDGHTWWRWAHLFREITDPHNQYVPNLFNRPVAKNNQS